MSDRIDINDIQAFFRHTNVEDCLKNRKEREAVNEYKEVYHKLLNAEYKKRTVVDCLHIFKNYSQSSIEAVKDIAILDKEIQKLDSELELMEQSKLFKQIHYRAVYGKSNSNFNLKEKIVDVLGPIGVILYYLFSLFISVLPFVMIGKGFFLTMLFTGISMFFPLSSVVFWIWGLVCAINGIQDLFAIIYYIVFIVLWLPYFFSVAISFFKK